VRRCGIELVGEQIEQEADEEARARRGVDALHARAPSWWPQGLDGVIELEE
jgi:hypothetical protein